MWEQIELLEHHSDFTTHFIHLALFVGKFDSLNDNFSLLMSLEPVNATNKC